jgi:small subunit ribosomal protein S5
MSEFDNKRRGTGNKLRSPNKNTKEAAVKPASDHVEKLINVNRCAKVVKGGRRFSFSALIVRGDGKGCIGIGYGKANEVPDAIKKATEQSQKNLFHIDLKGTTIPHPVVGKADGSRVILRPACAGTGVLAGGVVREVLKALGVTNVLSKSLGSNNPLSLVYATLDALQSLRSQAKIKALRSTIVE